MNIIGNVSHKLLYVCLIKNNLFIEISNSPNFQFWGVFNRRVHIRILISSKSLRLNITHITHWKRLIFAINKKVMNSYKKNLFFSVYFGIALDKDKTILKQKFEIENLNYPIWFKNNYMYRFDL